MGPRSPSTKEALSGAIKEGNQMRITTHYENIIHIDQQPYNSMGGAVKKKGGVRFGREEPELR